MSELFDTIADETAQLDNPNLLSPSDDDFIDIDNAPEVMEEDDEEEDGETPEHVDVTSLVDADEAADIAIDMIDGVQAPVFMLLHRKHLVQKYFEEKEDYRLASEVQSMDEEEITAAFPDTAEHTLRCRRRYHAMMSEFKSKRADIALTDDERKRLHSPMAKLCKKSGFDVPPGVALIVCMSQICINRLIDVYWD